MLRNSVASWRDTCRQTKNEVKEKKLVAEKLVYLLKCSCQKAVSNAYLCIKDKGLANIKKQIILKNVILKKWVKTAKIGFETWKAAIGVYRKRLALEYLANQSAEEQVLQVAFNKLKEGICQSRIDKQILKYRAFRYWKNAKRKAQQKSRAAIIALKLSEYLKKSMLRKMFHAMQQDSAETKLESLSTNLQSIVSHHNELINLQAASRAEEEKNTKTLALKRVATYLNNRLYPYFSKWKRHCSYYKIGMEKLKRLIYTIYRNKIGSACQTWRKEANKISIRILLQKIKENREKNKEKQLEKLEKDNSMNSEIAKIRSKQLKKFGNNMELLRNQYLRYFIRDWKKRAIILKECEIKTLKMFKIFRQNRKRSSLQFYREKIKDINLEIAWEERAKLTNKNFEERKIKAKLARWKIFTFKMKSAKKQMLKAIIMFEKGQCKWGFQQWRRHIKEYNIDVEKEKERKLLVQEEEQKKIKEQADEINKTLQDEETNIKSRNKERALEIAWNIAVRQKILDAASALKKWREKNGAIAGKEFNVKKIIDETKLSVIRVGFHKWLQSVRVVRIDEEKKKVEEQKVKLKIGKRKSQLELSQRVESKTDAQTMLERAKVSAGKSREIAARILGNLIKKRDKNVYIGLHQAIFRQWKAIADKEKRISETLMGLAKRHIFENVLIKIKNAFLERKESENSIKACKAILSLSRKSLVKNAFYLWKIFTFSAGKSEFLNQMEIKENEITQVDISSSKLADKLHENEGIISHKRLKAKVLRAWKEISIRTNQNVDKISAFKRNRKALRLKFAINKWRSRTIATEKMQMKLQKGKKFHSKLIIKKFFKQFRKITRCDNALPNALESISQKFYMLNKIRGMNAIKSLEKSSQQSEKNIKTANALRIGRVAQRILRSRIIVSLGVIQTNAAIIKARTQMLSKSMLVIYLEKLRFAFKKIKDEKDKKELIEKVEKDGQTALKLEVLQNEIETMQNTFRIEGFDEDELNERVGRMKENKENLIKKAIGRWMCHLEQKENIIMVVDTWRKETVDRIKKRKVLKKLCEILQGNPLRKGFNRWRKSIEKLAETYRGVPKEELVEEYFIVYFY